MCWNGKNPQKAPQHLSRRKLQPSYRPTNKYVYPHTPKKIKNVYTKILRVENLETFNLKSSTEDASLISRGRLFHSPTILFVKLNLNKLVLERLVKRFGVSILLNPYPLSTSLENRTLESKISKIATTHLKYSVISISQARTKSFSPWT